MLGAYEPTKVAAISRSTTRPHREAQRSPSVRFVPMPPPRLGAVATKRRSREQIVVADVRQTRAAEEGRTKPLFKTVDRLADGGRRNARTPRGFGKTACLCCGDEPAHPGDMLGVEMGGGKVAQ